MKQENNTERRLKRIRFESSGGSMDHHSEFELEADADEIIRTSYWKDRFRDSCEAEADPAALEAIDLSFRTDNAENGMTVREHIPMDSELWRALTEEIDCLSSQLHPLKRPEKTFSLPADVFILDGGDYTRLWLTWDIGGSEQTVQYYPPQGKRWYTVIVILYELARPVGRDLCRVGETELTEFFLKAPRYSYQITPIRDSTDNSFYLFVHGDSADISRITQEQWLPVREYLKSLDLSDCKAGKYESRYFLRLNYNDSTVKSLSADKALSEQIRGFIRSSVLGET